MRSVASLTQRVRGWLSHTATCVKFPSFLRLNHIPRNVWRTLFPQRVKGPWGRLHLLAVGGRGHTGLEPSVRAWLTSPALVFAW